MAKKSLNLTQFAGVINTAMGTAQVPDATLDLSKIYVKIQVRKKFRNIEELAESIKLNGIIEPLIVHEEPDGRYRLIIGERRLKAAPIANLTAVPVIIKRGLSDFEIRMLQVAENNDREDLTALEVARGVIEDVLAYGAEEARKIWNRSAGWISKRMSVQSYLPLTLSILEEELSGDLEVLSVLNQIEELDAVEVSRYKAHLVDGKPLPRDEIRNKLALMKKQKDEAEAYAAEKNAEIASNIANSELKPDTEDEVDEGEPEASSSNVVSIKNTKQNNKPAPSPDHHKKISEKAVVPAAPAGKPKSGAAKAPERDLKAERRQVEQELLTLRKEAVEWGDGNGMMVKDLQEKFRLLGANPDEAEFVLWSCFLDSILPMLAALGPERSKAYIARLQSDSKKKGIELMYSELHPTQELGAGINGKIEVPVMPDGWKF